MRQDKKTPKKPVLKGPKGKGPKRGPKKPCKLTKAQFRDRIKGMLLLSAYADALGAAHELKGLQGKTGDPKKGKSLQPLEDYGRKSASPFGVWVDPKGPLKKKKGIVTDDTSIRVTILHQWLCSVAGQAKPPDEKSFRKWLAAEAKKPASTLAEKMRNRAIRSFILMYRNADAYEAAKKAGKKFTPIPTPPDLTSFWAPDRPVVFGQFLFLEMAVLFAGCDDKAVFKRFRNMSVLDQGIAKTSSGLLAALLAKAICRTGRKKPFNNFFFDAIDEIINAGGLSELERTTLINNLESAKKLGTDNKKKSAEDFLKIIKKQIYDKWPQTADGLWKFHPLLFLRQMAAAVAWVGGDIRKALQVLVVGPGDADTIPSQLASIIGAYCGEKALRALGGGFSKDLDQVRDCTEKNIMSDFKVKTFAGICKCLEALALKHACCKIK